MLHCNLILITNWCAYAMLQILFVSGVSLTIGPKSTVQFFTKPKNHKVCTIANSIHHEDCAISVPSSIRGPL